MGPLPNGLKLACFHGGFLLTICPSTILQVVDGGGGMGWMGLGRLDSHVDIRVFTGGSGGEPHAS